jgi:hypothetical protein
VCVHLTIVKIEKLSTISPDDARERVSPSVQGVQLVLEAPAQCSRLSLFDMLSLPLFRRWRSRQNCYSNFSALNQFLHSSLEKDFSWYKVAKPFGQALLP